MKKPCVTSKVVCVLAAAFLLVGGVSFEGGPALAADNGEMLIRKGVELRRKGLDNEAVDLFRQAYDLSHSPRAAAQLGLCEYVLGRWADAEQHLSESLLAESDPWISSKRATISDARAAVRQHLGAVRVEGTPAGALVTINEHLAGQLPLTAEAWVVPGPVTIVVRKDGYEPRSFAAKVVAGDIQRIDVTLTKPVTVAPSTAFLGEDSPPETARPRTADEVPARSAWRTYATWGAFGLSAAALGLGVVSHVQREADVGRFNDRDGDCRKHNGVVVSGGLPCERLDSAIAGHSTRLTIGYVGAALFAAAGAVLWWTKPSGDEKSVACGVSPLASTSSSLTSAGSIQCSGTF